MNKRFEFIKKNNFLISCPQIENAIEKIKFPSNVEILVEIIEVLTYEK